MNQMLNQDANNGDAQAMGTNNVEQSSSASQPVVVDATANQSQVAVSSPDVSNVQPVIQQQAEKAPVTNNAVADAGTQNSALNLLNNQAAILEKAEVL